MTGSAGPPLSGAALQAQRRFRESLQHSEQKRVVVLLGVLIVLGLLSLLRLLTDRTGAPSAGSFLLFCGAVVYAGGLAWILRGARRTQRLLPDSLWALSAILEALLPSAVLATQMRPAGAGSLPPLLSPALLLYGVVTCLAILRLRPWLCWLSGSVGAVGYAGLIAGYGASGGALDLALLGVCVGHALFIALTGCAAALVSREIRRHVGEAIRAAEYRRELEGLSRELKVAKEIQQGLIPARPPTIDGYDIAFFYRPAASVGGDHCDWRELPNARCALAVADVSGHGIASGLLMAACSSYNRAVLTAVHDPSRALAILNRLLMPELSNGQFITFALAVLDPRQHVVEVASAGHGPTFHLKGTARQVRVYGGTGLPLGVSQEETYEPAESIALDAGDALVLLTDGYVERSRADGLMYGQDRLATLLAEHWCGDAGDFVRALNRDSESFANHLPHQDDMTVLVIGRCPGGSPGAASPVPPAHVDHAASMAAARGGGDGSRP